MGVTYGEPPADPLSPALSWAMAGILPGPDETRLLRALLHRGDSAREAWRAFRAHVPDLPGLFRTDTGGRKRLTPLLLFSLRENGIEEDPSLMTVLRTAWLREELRAREFARVLREVLTALDERGVPFLVLKGAALAWTAYPEPCLRHAHDIDLLIEPGAEEEAAHALSALGLVPSDDLRDGRGRSFRHRTELPVLLLERVYRQRFYLAGSRRLFGDAVEMRLGGFAARTPDPSHHLVHALGHASYCPGRATLSWATDAWMLMHASPGIDWERVTDLVAEARLELPVFVMLRYLAREIEAPVPDACLDGLGRKAAASGVLARDVALSGKRRVRGRTPGLEGARRPRLLEALRVWGWELLPSHEYLRWVHGDRGGLLPLLYVTRPLSVLWEKLGWRVRRLWRGRGE